MQLEIADITFIEVNSFVDFLYDIDYIIVTHIHPDLNNKQEELEETGNKYLGENKVSIAYDGLKMEI